jgi:hypothetical protein
MTAYAQEPHRGRPLQPDIGIGGPRYKPSACKIFESHPGIGHGIGQNSLLGVNAVMPIVGTYCVDSATWATGIGVKKEMTELEPVSS